MIKRLIPVVIALLVMNIICVWLFTLPAPFWSKDLSNNGVANIATSISGLTTPLLTLASIFLIYITFSEQKEGNKQQKRKNEFDKLLNLFNHAKENLHGLKIRGTVKGEHITYTGYEGLHRFMNAHANDDKSHFQMVLNSTSSDEIFYIFQSFVVIKKALKEADITYNELSELKELYNAFIKYHLLHPIDLFLAKFGDDNKHEIIAVMKELKKTL
jgi:hypothetical protein